MSFTPRDTERGMPALPPPEALPELQEVELETPDQKNARRLKELLERLPVASELLRGCLFRMGLES